VIINILLFAFVTPLVGIWLMEGGDYGPSIGRSGYPNGATAAFALSWTLLAVIAWFVVTVGRPRGRGEVHVSALHDRAFRQYATNLFCLNFILLMMHLFVFGGVDVLTGKVGKGEYRVQLGPYGAVAFMLVKFIIPAAFAYAAFLYRASRSSSLNTALLFANAMMIVIYGAAWGTKSTSAAVLLPGLVILYWRTTFKQLAIMSALVFTSFIAFSYAYDVDDLLDAVQFVWDRLTVIQGDVPWLAWATTMAGDDMPRYGPTLLAVFGDHTLHTFLGLSVTDYATWVDHHYGLMVTEFGGAGLTKIEEGHNLTGTFFTEGLIAGGRVGVIVFSIIGGVIVGYVIRKISQARHSNRPMAAALWTTYFCFCVFPWLNGGGITQFLHISTLAGLLLSGAVIGLVRSCGVDLAREREPAYAVVTR
jgi:hypothetical protein